MGGRYDEPHVHGRGHGRLRSLSGLADRDASRNSGADVWSGEAKLGDHLRNGRSNICLAQRSPSTFTYVVGLYLCFSLWAQVWCLTSATDIPRTKSNTGLELPYSLRTYTPKWRPSEIFVHTGKDDPFCFSEVRYSEWWFEKSEREAHCVKEMIKMKCHLMRFLDFKDENGFLMMKKAIRCIGMKDSSKDIKAEKGSWRRVWFGNYSDDGTTKYPRVVSTPVIKLRDKGRELVVNAQVLEYGLVFYSVREEFKGMMNYHGNRRDFPFRLFLVSDPAPVFRHEGETRTRLGFAKECTELIAIKRCTYCEGGMNDQMAGFWGIGGIPCRKEPTPVSELYYEHEPMDIDDQTTNWWRATLSAISGEFTNIWNSLVDSVFDSDWQGMILTLLCIYYGSHITLKNHWLSLALTIAYSFSRYFR